MRILVLGGSFNPVHIGHLILGEELAAEFGYDRVLLVPARVPPHKELRDDPGPAHRLAMLEAAVAGDGLFSVDDRELSREGPSYTVDTLRDILGSCPMDGKPGLVLGDDLAAGFPSWKDPEAILSMAELVVARRSGQPLDLAFPHRLAANLLIPVSSTLVRQRISAGGAWRHLVPAAAAAYITEHGLYRTA